jgi:hypothetical protein
VRNTFYFQIGYFAPTKDQPTGGVRELGISEKLWWCFANPTEIINGPNHHDPETMDERSVGKSFGAVLPNSLWKNARAKSSRY